MPTAPGMASAPINGRAEGRRGKSMSTTLDRRSFLGKFGALGGLALAGGLPDFVRPALAAAESSVPLRLFNQNTKENFDVDLFLGSEWNPNALLVCDWLMRDWRQNRMETCDRKLYAALYVIQRYFAEKGRICIHSGFRTDSTNSLLREMGYGAAPNSMHKSAKAIDFSIQGTDLRQVARACWNLNLGGIGLYSGWVHLDTRGQPVTWGLPL